MKLILTFLVLLVFASPVNALTVLYSNQRLTIACENTPFAQVAKALSDKLGIIVYLDKSQQSTKLTVNIQNMPFERALKMLTFPLNYALVIDNLGKPQELRIFKNPSIKDSEYARFGSANLLSQFTEPIQQMQQQGPQPLVQAQVFETKTLNSNTSFIQTSGVKGNEGLAIASWVTARMLQKDQLMQNAYANFKYQQALKASAEPAVIAFTVNALNSGLSTLASTVATQTIDTSPLQTNNNSDIQPAVAVNHANLEIMKSDPRLQQYAQMMLATSKQTTISATSSAYVAYMQMLTQKMAQQAMIANQAAQSSQNTPMRYLIGQGVKGR